MNRSEQISEKTEPTVKVWDLPTRLFHWTLVILVAVALVTEMIGPAWWLGVHVAAGYGIGALLLFRIVWGVVGPEPSRFASFAWPPRAVVSHLRHLVRGRPDRHVGHNPAGAMMVFALLIVLVLLAMTGMLALGGQVKDGPFAGVLTYALGHDAKEIHEALANLLLALIAAHVGGVVVASILERESLVRAMITGRKRRLPGDPPAPSQPGHPGRAAGILALAAALIAGGWVGLGRLPPYGVPVLPANPTYRAECGDCHWAYHPSLLPADSWRRMMAGLDDHFGENASLKPATAAAIEAYLTTYASEAWDTAAANRFRQIAPDQPLRITATRFWERRHRSIPKSTFADKRVGGKGNCKACHSDADTGRFDARKIILPLETRS